MLEVPCWGRISFWCVSSFAAPHTVVSRADSRSSRSVSSSLQLLSRLSPSTLPRNIDVVSTPNLSSEGRSPNVLLRCSHLPGARAGSGHLIGGTIANPFSLATVGLFLIPESPRWYVARGKIEQARKSLLRLNGKVRDYNVDHELAILSKEVADGQAMTKDASTYSVWEVLKGTNLVSHVIESWIHPRL